MRPAFVSRARAWLNNLARFIGGTPTTVVFTQSPITLGFGTSLANPADVRNAAGEVMNPRAAGTMSYQSDDPLIATVDASTGTVTGVTAGTCNITATFSPS